MNLAYDLAAVDLLDYERHYEKACGTHAFERGHQHRRRGRLFEVGHLSARREGVEHAHRAFVSVRQRKHREHRIVLVEREQTVHHTYVRRQIAMGEHHALGARHGSRGVDDDRQIVGRGDRRRALFRDALRYDGEAFCADHYVERGDRIFRELGEELVRNEQRFGLGVLDEHVKLLAREIGQDGDGHHARRHDGEVADSPVRHVAAQQRHFVARVQAGARK